MLAANFSQVQSEDALLTRSTTLTTTIEVRSVDYVRADEYATRNLPLPVIVA